MAPSHPAPRTARFRAPLPHGVRSGVHIQENPYGWRVVSTHENIDYEIREVPPGTLWESDDLAALSPRQHYIVDDGFALVHGAALRHYLEEYGVDYSWQLVRGGEESKTLATVGRLAGRLLDGGLGRRDLVVGVGGGAVLDLVGFTASQIYKGIPLALVSGTPLAYVDASVGVKRAVNLGQRKNAMGSYYEPTVVLNDVALLGSVPKTYTAAGLCEVLKMALIMGGALWERLEEFADLLLDSRCQTPEAAEIFRHAIHGMVVRLQPNLREYLLDREVDLGHLLGNLEREAHLPHGIAVGIDLALMTVYSSLSPGGLSADDRDRVLSVVRRSGAPICHPMLTSQLVREAIQGIIRQRDGLKLPVPLGIGHVVVARDVDAKRMDDAVALLRQRAGLE